MALKSAVLAILLVVSLIFADHVKCQPLVRSEGQELAGNGSGNGEVSPKSDCNEGALYHGPCLELICAAACILQMNRGGHCKGGFFGACLCFVCN
ncbi:hypothetical protein SETIT_7G069400v2 [Setaria italica]|uniref:Knottin scorpion toxin-like domain-containing protein n=1 Tax=Setaria italica TaxID=4555 RepID=K3YB57_SETIT|nr:hypothetical protein SETIT_7G069400v2 [Setaria italica]